MHAGVIMDETSLFEGSEQFVRWLGTWRETLGRRSFAGVVPSPGNAAIMSVDLINGFCYEGPLASPRVAAIVPAVVTLFERAHAAGVGQFLLFQDSHGEEALEFDAFGPHCVAGTRQAETIPELAGLPFSDMFRIVEKNTISSAIGTGLDDWISSNGNVDRFIIVGDCTDLCVYQLAMHLRLTANAADIRRAVIVPADCVDTYDMPVERAGAMGILPHDAGLLHALFLYHLALNGVEVIAGID
jgi:nicotinamidase-related amidase